MRHQFIQQEQRVYSPTLLCRVLQVSRSGYYASRQRVAQPKPVMEELDWWQPSSELLTPPMLRMAVGG